MFMKQEKKPHATCLYMQVEKKTPELLNIFEYGLFFMSTCRHG